MIVLPMTNGLNIAVLCLHHSLGASFLSQERLKDLGNDTEITVLKEQCKIEQFVHLSVRTNSI